MSVTIFALLVFIFDAGTAEAKRKKPSRQGRGQATASAGLSCQNPGDAKTCMICNCFNEAGGESYTGQVAVGKVVMTRVGISGFPKSVCGVIKQAKQFSWYNKVKTRKAVPRGHSCHDAATESLKFRGYFADHYYASYIRKPRWAKRMIAVENIGLHKFYSASAASEHDVGEQSAATRGVALMILRIPALAQVLSDVVLIETPATVGKIQDTI